MILLRSLIYLLRAAVLQRSTALAFGRPHQEGGGRQTSDGGRRVPRPLALARRGRPLRRRLCAPGAAASPAARLPQTA
eukprot:4116433-Pyramimonas_sp.AAC.1